MYVCIKLFFIYFWFIMKEVMGFCDMNLRYRSGSNLVYYDNFLEYKSCDVDLFVVSMDI